MDKNKAKEYLSIAAKAGYLIIGSDKLKSYKQKLYLILLDEGAGKSSIKIAEKFNEVAPILQVENLGSLCQISSCKVLGIKNKAMADIIANYLK